jgi:hypothetical protein
MNSFVRIWFSSWFLFAGLCHCISVFSRGVRHEKDGLMNRMTTIKHSFYFQLSIAYRLQPISLPGFASSETGSYRIKPKTDQDTRIDHVK